MDQILINVVDESDIVIGSKLKEDIHRLGLLHREAHVWLFDKDQNIYFSISAPHKTSAGLLDSSIGGHLDHGEDYLTAAVRETFEEAGLLVNPADLIFLTKFREKTEHKKKGVINNFFRSVYIYKFPVAKNEIKHDPGESDGHKIFSPEFLENMSEEDTKLFHKFVPTHELPHVLKYLNNL